MTIKNNFPNIRPSLLLDFAALEKLDPRISFTRATTARYYDGKTTALAEQTVSRLYFGPAPAASFSLDGCIKSLRFYPSRLTNSQLITLSQ